ncbi:uncharacterized protein LOC143569890 isoform X2 [Bidens hawaiensis]|uniref:uncharacterized protein LOC143569890 isoform X2 n=1 Tax=Bidens hawaiensis TaxID=980011 RepID=UPI004048EB45
MDKKVHNKDILGCVEIDIADVVQVKHMNNTYQIGNGKIRVELRFLDYQNLSTNSYFSPNDGAKAIDMAFKSEDVGVLVVTIHRGVNLEVKHPFVTLLVGTDKRHTTTKKHNQNPV